jgi:FkbM family methyltransferase
LGHDIDGARFLMFKARLAEFVSKRVRARRLGVPLVRSRDFRVPTHVRVEGERVRLDLPAETGVRVAFYEILLADCYGLESLAGPVETVLDVGANVGLFCLAARRAFPGATIHAYEPNPHLERHLRVQAALARCRYFMEAIGGEAGRVSLELHPDSVQSRSRCDDRGQVPMVAFRTAIARLGGMVDLAKVDCEGAEWDLWADQASWERVRHLSLEYHLWPDHSHEEARAVIEDLGFVVRRQVPDTGFGLILASRR